MTVYDEIISKTLDVTYYCPGGFNINKEDIVIDIGAHVGSFTVFAAKIAQEGQVYSYEPHPDNFRWLKENIKINKLENVKIFNYGVFGKEKTAKLFHNEKDVCRSIYRNSEHKNDIIDS